MKPARYHAVVDYRTGLPSYWTILPSFGLPSATGTSTGSHGQELSRDFRCDTVMFDHLTNALWHQMVEHVNLSSP